MGLHYGSYLIQMLMDFASIWLILKAKSCWATISEYIWNPNMKLNEYGISEYAKNPHLLDALVIGQPTLTGTDDAFGLYLFRMRSAWHSNVKYTPEKTTLAAQQNHDNDVFYVCTITKTWILIQVANLVLLSIFPVLRDNCLAATLTST